MSISSVTRYVATTAAVAFLLVAATTGDCLAEGYGVRPASFDQVMLEDDFWLPRLRTQRQVLVPYALEQTSEALADLRAAGELLAGRRPDPLPAPHRYRTSDLFKVVEGAAYLLAIERDPVLKAQLDRVVEAIGAAQEPNGFLNATRTLYPHVAIDMMGDGAYTYVDHSHELYIVGHLYEAAVAYYHATGDKTLLEIAHKNALHVRHVFFEGDAKYNGGRPINQAPGHEEIELALVRLAEATGDPIHLDTAKRFLDIRGVTYRPTGQGVDSPAYAQQHLPVAEQKEPAGHAVRATYLYAGMADVGAKLGVSDYDAALDAIWKNIVDTRMHLTGGLGAVHGIEGFGDEHQLPNADAFDETCAGVGAVLFNWRLFLRRHDAKFIDVAEVALYNNVLAGTNLAGDRFFYVNPLAADGFRAFNHGHAGRAPWFGTACCPTNLARLIPQVPGMLFAQDNDGLMLCLYAAAKTRLTLGGVDTEVVEQTGYPFDGAVNLTIQPEKPARFAVRLRVPTWATDRFVPGDLYHYTGAAESAPVRLLVNDSPVEVSIERGFVSVDRTWTAGDHVRLELPMPVRFSTCRSEVEANRGRVAITRGPLVYCAEGVDNTGHTSTYMVPPESIEATAEVGPMSIAGHATRAVTVAAERIIDGGDVEPASLGMVPYYAWNNRGVGSMAVWLPDNLETLRDSALVVDDNARRFTSATASHTYEGDSTGALVDGLLPRDSYDTSIPRWTSWPHRGESQTIELELAQPTDLQSVGVYWYDDHGGVQTPLRWELQVREGDAWRPFPLYTTDEFGVAPDQFNVVHPGEPMTVDRLRLEVWPRPDAAAGILEVMVRSNEE
ncbi:Non-reducing end beta-L-arabinofuranosidase [Botrimarina colliarenosi]|uniref:Non-reducing end beta-L-arabinofuranosidase n=1 Tax=Botrimarina colliarenosi TaxID=2528001 RepID=A0A5C6AHX4_9BACT|nr:beta-L-arabinofuranosidase domain-containing protein [Botrimarina colliarenosi]TWT97833.1 Non-reducing end beta-L-arabinofuranosidase [Botrimarina colliarenosi]